MSHGLTKWDTMFSVSQKPWHKLGTVVENAPNVHEALVLAGLDWHASLEPAFSARGEALKTQVVRRSDTDQIIGEVGDRYKPLQNVQAFSFFDPFVESGQASFETAGSLFGGSKVWIMCKISKDPLVVGSGDEIMPYILLSTSHDGSSAVRVGYTPIRVVCNNTLTMAHGHGSSKLIKVKHSLNVVSNLNSIQETMNLVNRNFEATVEQYKDLTKRQIVTSDLEKYVDLVFSTKGEDEKRERKSRVYDDILQNFEQGQGSSLPTAHGTAWGAYNAVTEYLSHSRGSSQENRYNSLWFSGQDLNKKALEYALTL